jgi:hypothetical protein
LVRIGCLAKYEILSFEIFFLILTTPNLKRYKLAAKYGKTTRFEIQTFPKNVNNNDAKFGCHPFLSLMT